MGADPLAELLVLEHRGWDSLCDGTGATFYGSLMTDDGVMVLANGQAMTRNEVVESLQHAPPWQGYDIADHGPLLWRPAMPRWSIAAAPGGTGRRPCSSG